jgi:hypothetical protein
MIIKKEQESEHNESEVQVIPEDKEEWDCYKADVKKRQGGVRWVSSLLLPIKLTSRHIQYFFLKKDGEMANQAEHFSLMYFKVEAKGQVFVDAVERYWLVYENQNLKSEYKDQARAAGFA